MVQYIGFLLKVLQFTVLQACVVQTFKLEFQILAVRVVGLKFRLEPGQLLLEVMPLFKAVYIIILALAVGGYGVYHIQLE